MHPRLTVKSTRRRHGRIVDPASMTQSALPHAGFLGAIVPCSITLVRTESFRVSCNGVVVQKQIEIAALDERIAELSREAAGKYEKPADAAEEVPVSVGFRAFLLLL